MISYRKNFGFTHKSGILMPVSSLPSPYGIGGFGKTAYAFVDFLEMTHQQCWQVLPLNPTAYGDSPYQSPASMAGNPYFIDPEILKEKGLLTADELKDAKHTAKKVDYGWLFNTRFGRMPLQTNCSISRRSWCAGVHRNDRYPAPAILPRPYGTKQPRISFCVFCNIEKPQENILLLLDDLQLT